MKLTLYFLVFLFTMNATAQTISPEVLEAFEEQTITYEGKDLPYRVLYPEDFDENKTYPLHLFLHGAGERGNDNESQLVHGSELFLEMNKKYPAIVIFPQCPKEDYWADVAITRNDTQNVFSFPKEPQATWAMGAVLSLLDSTLEHNYIDKDRVYLGGLSMGGMGTFELLNARPTTFAAATPICGAGYPANVASWAEQTPAWIFHGEVDAVVPAIYSQLMVEALVQQGISPRFSLYPNVNHDSWTNAFAEPDFFSWVYSHSKGDAIDASEKSTEKSVENDCTPEWLKFSESTLLTKYEEDNATLAATSDPDRIVFMGDSITEGWLDASPEFWSKHSNFVNRGVSGHTTPQMLLRFRKDVIDLKPKKVIILAGTNDIAGNTGATSIETVAENIITMAELASFHNIEVVLSSVLPVYDYPWKTGLEPAQKIIDLNAVLKSYAAEHNHTYIDYHLVMKDANDGMQALLSYDGVHCTNGGYEVMENVLKRNLGIN